MQMMTQRATAKLWILVRFKRLGGSQTQLLKVYQARIRSILEFASLLFNSGLTKQQSNQIEMVQKKAFAVILGRKYQDYEHALHSLQQERLDTRRAQLSLRFALKASASSRHSAMFPRNPNFRVNARNSKPFMEYQCNTNRYYTSAVPSMARLLNHHQKTS